MAAFAPFPLVNPPQSALPISIAASAAAPNAEEFTQVRRNRKPAPPAAAVAAAATKPTGKGKGKGQRCPKKATSKAAAKAPKGKIVAEQSVLAAAQDEPVHIHVARIPLHACLGQPTAQSAVEEVAPIAETADPSVAAAKDGAETPSCFITCFTSTGGQVNIRLGTGQTPQDVVDEMSSVFGIHLGKIVSYSRSLTKAERARETECIQARADRIKMEENNRQRVYEDQMRALAEERRERATPDRIKTLHTKKCGWCKETAQYREANTQRCSSCKEKGYLEVVYNK